MATSRGILLCCLALSTVRCSLLLDPTIHSDQDTKAQVDTAAGSSDAAGTGKLSGPPKVGFVYVGPVGDHGWTLTHDLSRKYLESNVPGIETSFAPSVSAVDAPAVIDDLLEQGHNVIVGTSYDFLVPVQSKAANNPGAQFLICSGFVTSPNLGSYFGRMYQVKWMAGQLAGRMTRTNRIGIVGPVVIPETVRHINAFTMGVRAVNPDAVVHVRWVNAWFAPDEEAAATKALVDAGADIILGSTDTTVPLEVSSTLKASDGGPVYSIGYDNPDSCKFAPKTCMASAYWNWGPLLARILGQMVDGTWDSTDPIWEQMKSDPKESIVYLSEMNTDIVPTATRLEIEGLIPKLAEPGVKGQQLPFPGPIKDTAGKERLGAGKQFTDAELLRMCWFVQGVVGDDVDGKPTPGVVPGSCPGDK